MSSAISIPFQETGTINDLVSDYLEKKDSLKKFYNAFPSPDAFRSELESEPYKSLDRKNLSSILYAQAEKVSNTSESTFQNIRSLEKENVFTITTGHQLCLFTGPLYFVYKIFSVINLCEQLEKEFPSHKFVPVYWAATEDHDFEEVNHFNAFEKKIIWESAQQGAVGNFSTSELRNLLPQLQALFGESENALRLISLFESAYLKHDQLDAATRFMVNELFGEYGLVTVDGNDREFKTQFIEEFKADIFDNNAFKNVSATAEDLKKSGYNIQVNPREINCFLLEKNRRTRIERRDGNFALANEEKIFSEKEMVSLIEHTPEKISPNVVLRPLYQQTILPNLAYIGGPGELAYWLEYKEMFDSFGKYFPLLIMRSSFTLIDSGTLAKSEKLDLKIEEFFKPLDEIIKTFLLKRNRVFEAKEENRLLNEVFSGLENKISEIDKTLSATVKAELQKSLNSLQMIEGKANRALKQQADNEVKQISNIKEKFFPQSILQERHDNFSMYFIRYGKPFLSVIKENVIPFEVDHRVISI